MTYCIKQTFIQFNHSFAIILSVIQAVALAAQLMPQVSAPGGHTWPQIGHLAPMAASDWSLALQLPAPGCQMVNISSV